MRRTRLMLAALGALAAVLVVPAAAFADGATLDLANTGKLPRSRRHQLVCGCWSPASW